MKRKKNQIGFKGVKFMKTTKAEEKSKLWLKKNPKKKYLCISIQTLKKKTILM